MLFSLRVAALYRGVRGVIWLLWPAFAVFQGLRVAVLLFGDAEIFGEPTFKQLYKQTDSTDAGSIGYSPISNLCIVGSTNYRPTALIAVPTVLDLLLLVLTALKAIRNPVSLKAADSIVCGRI